MPLVTVSQLSQVGAVPDRALQVLPPNAWAQALNVRFAVDGVRPFAGSNYVDYFALRDPTSAIRGELLYRFLDGTNYYYFGTDTKIWVTDGATYTDVSGSAYSLPSLNSAWQGTVFNGVPIFNFDGATPQMGDASSATATFSDLTDWPAGMTCKVVRSFGNYLVALDVTESGTRYPNMVRWSHQADPGAVPQTAGGDGWNYAEPSVDAGRTVIAETDGAVVDSLQMGRANIIYKTDGAWTMERIGGIFIFRFARATGVPGLLTRGCAVQIPQGHFIVTRDDVMVWALGNPPKSIARERVRNTLFDEIDDDKVNETFCAHNPQFKEVWVCYPTVSDSDVAYKAAVWNYERNVWTFRTLPGVSGACNGRVSVLSSGGTYDTATKTYNQATSAYNAATGASESRLLMGSYKTGQVHVMDVGFMEGDTPDGTTSGDENEETMERRFSNTSLAVSGQDQQGSPKVDPGQRFLVNRLWLLAEGERSDELTIKLGSRERIGDSTYFDPRASFTFTLNEENQVPVVISGKYVNIDVAEVASVESLNWLVSSLEYEIMPAGKF